MDKKKQASKNKSSLNTLAITEKLLTENLSEDLLEAWKKIKQTSLRLGEQRVYASGKAIMFSKKFCFFFVRPRKSFLEVVVFLPNKSKAKEFKSVQAVSKTKYAHTFKLFHGDQIEGALELAIAQAYKL